MGRARVLVRPRTRQFHTRPIRRSIGAAHRTRCGERRPRRAGQHLRQHHEVVLAQEGAIPALAVTLPLSRGHGE
jgi:hypothetical protein